MFINSKNSGFRIIKYSPPLNSVSTITPYIDVDFSDPLASTGLYIYSYQNIVSSYKIFNSNYLRIYLKVPLQIGIKYQLKFVSVMNKSNGYIKDSVISFSPKNVGASSLTKDQIKYLTDTQNKSTTQIYNTSLVGILPYLSPGDEFLVSYEQINGTPYITITSASQQGYNNGILWISSQGYNPSKLNIKYIDQQPY